MVKTPSSNHLNDVLLPQSSFIKNVHASPDQRRDAKANATTGASAASARTIGSQLIAFYFRAPVKAFFRTRVE